MEGTPVDDGPTLRHAWDTLGTAAALVLEGAELVQVDLPFLAPVGTSVGAHRSRPLVLVHLRCRVPGTGEAVDGWGECAALGDATYDAEDVGTAWDTLAGTLLPALGSAVRSLGGMLPSLGALRRLSTVAPGRPLSFSALEAAVCDAHLRAARRSLADLFGASGAEVAPGAVVGTAGSPDALVAAVAERAAQGYVRVKVKIAPGTELATVSALTRWAATATGNVPRFQVDANGAYRPDDLGRLIALDGFGLLCIEQPFARDDLDSHRALSARMATPICLDESLDSPMAVEEAVSTGACSVVCVKPARLGGMGNALDVVSWCSSAGVPWWVGGMFESGLGRRVTTALGALPGTSLAGDLAPPDDYLAADLVGPEARRVDPGTGRLTIAVSDVPGTSPLPEESVLVAHVVRRVGVLVAG
jgi:O-succinylbenzoate synthase